MAKLKRMRWDADSEERLLAMWGKMNIGQITYTLGCSRESVSAKARELNLPKISRFDSQRFSMNADYCEHRAFTPRCAELLGWEWRG